MPMTEELAMRVVNLREALRQANRCIEEHAKARGLTCCLMVACNETDRPSLRGGREFWAAVRELTKETD